MGIKFKYFKLGSDCSSAYTYIIITLYFQWSRITARFSYYESKCLHGSCIDDILWLKIVILKKYFKDVTFDGL